ncbi:CYTH domain-containing protein [Candidatus Kaiserbacteria bacterium]|nr:CYTH domain-containing protein [Candidatus Kaiserbacteria bacterium]
MIELELTYLAKSLPTNLTELKSKKIIDLYVDNGTDHSDLRIRRNGDKFELTRKTPVDDGDASKQTEVTIPISKTEFESFLPVKARKVEKTRYYLEHGDRTAEFDVFKGDLSGLVVIDFEFNSEEEKDSFEMPDFCLEDITQETFIAGGVLAGKTYSDIESELNRFNYTAL